MTSADVVDDALVGRCYTRARTIPPMIGQLSFPGGEKRQLAGGPYSIHQLVAFLVALGLVWISRGLWGSLGPVAVMLALMFPFAASFFVRHARVEGRSPFAVIAGWLTYWTSPAAGRLRGRTFRPKGEVLATLRLHCGAPPKAALAGSSIGSGLSDTAGGTVPDTAPSHAAPTPPSSRSRPLLENEPVTGPADPAAAVDRPGMATAGSSRRRPASHLQLLLSAQRTELDSETPAREVG